MASDHMTRLVNDYGNGERLVGEIGSSDHREKVTQRKRDALLAAITALEAERDALFILALNDGRPEQIREYVDLFRKDPEDEWGWPDRREAFTRYRSAH